MLNKLSWDTSYYGVRLHISCYHSSSSDDGIVADGNTLQDGSVRTYPHILTQYYRGRISMHSIFRSNAMIERGKDNTMSDLASITYCYAAMVLEMTAGIDKHILTNLNILSEICIKRWKRPQRSRHFIAEQTRK